MVEEGFQVEKSLNSILENSRDLICRFNVCDQKIEYLSPDHVTMKISGRSCDELLSMKIDDLRTLIDARDLVALDSLPVLFRRENGVQLTFSISLPGGNKRKLSGWFAPLYSEESELCYIDCFIQVASSGSEKDKEILDTIPVILTMIRPDYTIKWCNKAYREALGNNEGGLCYRKQFNLDKPCSECQAFLPLKTGKPHNWQWTLPDGRTFDIHNFLIRDSDGSPLILEMDIDITGWRKAEISLKDLNEALGLRVAEHTEELRKSQIDLQHAQRIANIGNWRLDPATEELFWSGENYQIFGIAEGTRLNYTFFLQLVHPDDREDVDKSWKAALAGKDYDLEHRIMVNGMIKWVREKAYLEFDGEGKLIAAFGISQDVTSRRMAEDKLKESEARLRMALESGKIGVWEWNLKTGNITWDDRMEKMFGVPPGWFGGTYDDFERLIHDEDVAHFRKAIDDTLRTNMPFETIYRIRYGKKGIKYISSKAQLKYDRSGRPLLLSGVCFDITGLKEGTENLISRLNQELLRSNRELESFAYVASHDLQEPLRMITSFTQLLEVQYGEKLDARAREYIEYATSGAKRMYDLINSLLAYSRINKKELAYARIDVNKVVDAVRKNLSLKILEKEVLLNTEKLPFIYGDYDQMVHLFQNIIANGIKFSKVNPVITITAKASKGYWTFSISDNGIGIEPQYFERIFQIFQRLHPREHYEGTGIGLAICKRIVERHGGRIWIESQPGKGSAFFFTLPRTAPVIKPLTVPASN
ncbi:MAG TPA: PAS domain-containing protein [Bacteroidales bacterium]|nr:PAS domain-containing protein [Bacteroidales bacterium]